MDVAELVSEGTHGSSSRHRTFWFPPPATNRSLTATAVVWGHRRPLAHYAYVLPYEGAAVAYIACPKVAWAVVVREANKTIAGLEGMDLLVVNMRLRMIFRWPTRVPYAVGGDELGDVCGPVRSWSSSGRVS